MTRLIWLTTVVALGLAACSSSQTPAEGQPPTPTPSETASESPSPSVPECEVVDPADAIADGLANMPAPFEGLTTDEVFISADDFDTCAPLEIVEVRLEDSEGAPAGLMLFHEGRFIRPATAEPYEIVSTLRINPATVTVQYRMEPVGHVEEDATLAAISSFTWDDATSDVVWAGQLPGYRMSEAPIRLEHFGSAIPEEAVAALGEALAETATLMETQLLSEIAPELGDDPFAQIPNAGIAAADERTRCDIMEAFMRCWNPEAQWPLSLDEDPEATTTVIFVDPANGVSPSRVMGDGYGAPDGSETVLKPGEARFFNNYVCAASADTFACWDATTGGGFTVAGDELAVF